MGLAYNFSNGLISLALLFGLVATLIVPSESAPANYSLEREGEANTTTDPVWRMVAGGLTASSYMFYKQAVIYHTEEPLVSVNDSTAQSELLNSLLKGVCDLLSVYSIISKVDNSSDLYLLLSQNLVDSCNWLNYLVSSTWNATGSEDFLRINATCDEDSMPRLDHYCLQAMIRDPEQLRYLMQRTISDGLSTYYPTSPVVSESAQCEWLHSSLAISGEARERVEAGANLFCS